MKADRYEKNSVLEKQHWKKTDSKCDGSHTLAFCYPRNRHFYNSLTCFAFKDLVGGGTGVVQDCYILHASSLSVSSMVLTGIERLKDQYRRNEGQRVSDAVGVVGNEDDILDLYEIAHSTER